MRRGRRAVVHARRLGLSRRRVDAEARRRGVCRAARRASSPRRPGSSSSRTPRSWPWSRWITPEVVPSASTPASSSRSPRPTRRRSPTATEIDDAGWFAPRRRSTLTRPASSSSSSRRSSTLESLLPYRDRRGGAGGRPRSATSSRSCPRSSAPATTTAIVLPWEHGYDDAATEIERLPLMTSEPARQKSRECFERFITTEYTTVDAAPAADHLAGDALLRARAAPTIDVTTGLGYPKKADDAQRNPRVALLFSDPTGSGIESGHPGPGPGHRRGRRRTTSPPTASATGAESPEKLPATKDDAPAEAHARAVRLVLHAHLHQGPARARLRLAGRRPRAAARDPRRPPRGGALGPQSRSRAEPHAPAAGGAAAWDERIDELGAPLPDRRALLGRPDGFPLSVRVPVARRPRRATDRARRRARRACR